MGQGAEEVGLNGSPTMVKRIFTPPRRTGGRMLAGEIPDMVNELIKELQLKSII